MGSPSHTSHEAGSLWFIKHKDSHNNKAFKMMMLKMMNPFGSVTDSIPGVGGSKDDDEGMSKEEQEEQEKMRQEAIRQAERERRDKYKKQEEEREGMRQTIREKYNIEKKEDSDAEEDDDDDEDFGGGAKKAETDDPAEKAKQMAEAQLNQAKAMAQDKCSIQ